MQDCTFTNLQGTEGVFITIGIEVPESVVTISSSTFTNSSGIYGISFSDSASISLITRSCTVTGNDL